MNSYEEFIHEYLHFIRGVANSKALPGKQKFEGYENNFIKKCLELITELAEERVPQ